MAAVTSPGLAVLQELAWLRKNAALRADVPTMQWATVVTGSPLTVLVDHTTAPRQASANAVGPLMPGQRVRVELRGTILTVVNASPPPWQTPTLLNGWAHYPNIPAQWRQTTLGIQLRGMIRSGTFGQPAFSLGSGVFSRTHYVATMAFGPAMGRLVINTSGTVVPDAYSWGTSNNSWVILDNLLIPNTG